MRFSEICCCAMVEKARGISARYIRSTLKSSVAAKTLPASRSPSVMSE
jgi:hypothetical protein